MTHKDIQPTGAKPYNGIFKGFHELVFNTTPTQARVLFWGFWCSMALIMATVAITMEAPEPMNAVTAVVWCIIAITCDCSICSRCSRRGDSWRRNNDPQRSLIK